MLGYSSRRTQFSNILSIWANKNDDQSAILNLIRTKLHRIHQGMVINACVEYRKEIFIGVRDIHPDGQNFQIFCQFEQTKMVISRPFWIWSWRNFTGFIGRIVIKACVKYRKKIFIGVGDIHPDGQISIGRPDAQTDGRSPNHYPPQKNLVGDNMPIYITICLYMPISRP